jgi:ribosomal protein S15P/S13E
MDAGWAVFLASVVTASGGVVVTMLTKFRKENSKDHEVVTGILRMVYRSQQRTENKVDKVAERLADHIEEHEKDSQDS